jgi:hypothetical protein
MRFFDQESLDSSWNTMEGRAGMAHTFHLVKWKTHSLKDKGILGKVGNGRNERIQMNPEQV